MRLRNDDLRKRILFEDELYIDIDWDNRQYWIVIIPELGLSPVGPHSMDDDDMKKYIPDDLKEWLPDN